MNAKTKQAAPAKFATVIVVNGKPTMEYDTKVEGTPVQIYHAFRRRYTVRINGDDKGYITARSVMNAVGRVETAESLKALRAMLHK